MTKTALALLALLLAAPLAGAAGVPQAPDVPQVTESEPLIDLAGSARVLSTETFDLRLDLPKVFAEPHKGGTRHRPLAVTIVRLDGDWEPARSAATTLFYWGQRLRVNASDLRVSEDALTGTLDILFPDGKRTAVKVELDGAITRPGDGGPWQVEGTFTGPYFGRDGATSPRPEPHPFTGTFQPPVRPGGWNQGTVHEGRLRLAFDLGTERANWTTYRTAVYEMDAPADLAFASGLRVRIARDAEEIAASPPASASVWIREADGSWYYVKDAVPLCDPINESVLLWEDFAEAEWVAPTGSHMDEDYAIDLDRISHLAIGVVNPLGIGEVTFAVEAVDLVTCAVPEPTPAQVAVTGRMLSINDHDTVPPGLFGGYAPDLPQRFRPGCQRYLSHGPAIPGPGDTEVFKIDCWFDRYASATLLGTGEWAESLAGMVRRYAERVKDAGFTEARLEFWNEPYLNWAKPPGGRNYKLDFYDVSRAAEGAPVIVRKTGMVIPYLAWRKTRRGGWEVYDRTQFTYWSARANGFIYDRMLQVVGTTLKEINSDVHLLAGWDFRWNEDRWAAWDILYKPTIDRGIAWIDGLTEHHYQGDTTAMNGSYEVAVAYTKTRYDKWIYCYNTETNDLLDAPSRGAVTTPEQARRATHYRRSVYNLRDILRCVQQSPDKAAGRTVIHCAGRGVEPWTEVAYGLMTNLRGRLVEAASDDPRVWTVASVDGTDPKAMPPDPSTPLTLVVMVFNDHRVPRAVEVQVRAPEGTHFTGGTVAQTTVDKETWKIGVDAAPAGVEEGATAARFAVELADRGTWKVALPLAGTVPPKAEVVRRQFFSPDILAEVSRAAREFRTTVALEPGDIARAARATLRLVVEDIAPAEGAVTVGGQTIPLPKAWTADNVLRILELPLDPATLEPATEVVFRLEEGNHLGYRVDMTSIVLETRPGRAADPR